MSIGLSAVFKGRVVWWVTGNKTFAVFLIENLYWNTYILMYYLWNTYVKILSSYAKLCLDWQLW